MVRVALLKSLWQSTTGFTILFKAVKYAPMVYSLIFRLLLRQELHQRYHFARLPLGEGSADDRVFSSPRSDVNRFCLHLVGPPALQMLKD